jgi:hypothetical protein
LKRNGELSDEDQDLERSCFNVALHPSQNAHFRPKRKTPAALQVPSLEETKAIAEEGFI